MTTSTVCQCCEEDQGILAEFDDVLGALCPDCAEGANAAVLNLRKAGMERIYPGPCGDNEIPFKP